MNLWLINEAVFTHRVVYTDFSYACTWSYRLHVITGTIVLETNI